MFVAKEWVEAGGLMSYGESLSDMYHRGAYFVNRILKGAKPADLPVKQTTSFETGPQPQDGKGDQPGTAADAAGPRRRGDRVEETRVHLRSRRRGGSVAVRGARSTAGDAGDWVPPSLFARGFPPACIPPGLERGGLHRGRDVANKYRWVNSCGCLRDA
jgi:hypothetical protein